MVKSLVGAGLVDYIAMDMKGPLASYDRWCGCSVDTSKIRETIDFILEGRVDYEFRMTVVPFLHREQDVCRAAEEIGSARRFFLQDFVPRETLNEKYASVLPFTSEKMHSLRERVAGILEDAHIRSRIHE